MVIESIGSVMKALALLWIFELGGDGFPTMHSKHIRRPVRDLFSITQQWLFCQREYGAATESDSVLNSTQVVCVASYCFYFLLREENRSLQNATLTFRFNKLYIVLHLLITI